MAIPGIPEICFGTRCLKTVRAEPHLPYPPKRTHRELSSRGARRRGDPVAHGFSVATGLLQQADAEGAHDVRQRDVHRGGGHDGRYRSEQRHHRDVNAIARPEAGEPDDGCDTTTCSLIPNSSRVPPPSSTTNDMISGHPIP